MVILQLVPNVLCRETSSKGCHCSGSSFHLDDQSAVFSIIDIAERKKHKGQDRKGQQILVDEHLENQRCSP